ncbi:hypothetical protein GQ53DRAFT_821857 [Thozetella sp. PMI_491]|nr:hypothetical protein GQ53DRAFT_821857 [Thozetella sp. PMI_491]
MYRFRFLGHDNSFRIPWVEVYHSLLLANQDHFNQGDAVHPVVQACGVKGPGKQNAVAVADDFGDLGCKMEDLQRSPEVAEAIATNARNMFRERYLTSAETACDLAGAGARLRRRKLQARRLGGRGQEGRRRGPGGGQEVVPGRDAVTELLVSLCKLVPALAVPGNARLAAARRSYRSDD